MAGGEPGFHTATPYLIHPEVAGPVADKVTHPMLRGVIFDFNGVLLWDTQLQEEAWAQFARTLRPKPFGPRRCADWR